MGHTAHNVITGQIGDAAASSDLYQTLSSACQGLLIRLSRLMLSGDLNVVIRDLSVQIGTQSWNGLSGV